MFRYLAFRLLGAFVVVAIVVVVTFFIGRSVGDPVRQMLPPFAPEENFEQLRVNLGLDRPVIVQFGDFLDGLPEGDLGESLWQKRSVLTIIGERFPKTLLLAGAGLLLAFLIGVPLGIFAAIRPGSLFDRVSLIFSIGTISTPHFWLGLLLILLFAVWLGILPTSGSGSVLHLVLPAVTVAALPTGRIAQMVRSALLDVLVQPYVVTARSKGLTERVVITRHALRNAAIPVVTVAGWEVARVMAGGMVIVETVFAWPGIGLLTIQAIRQFDFPLVEASIMVQGAITVVANLVVDLTYPFLDPRIRSGAS